MLHRFKVDVVAYGPSLADDDSYFLIRAFPSLDARQKSEDAFYGSEEWKTGIREATLADIVNYTTVVRAVDADALHGCAGCKAMKGISQETPWHPLPTLNPISRL